MNFGEDIDDGQKAKVFYFVKTLNYLWQTFNNSIKSFDRFLDELNEKISIGIFPNPFLEDIFDYEPSMLIQQEFRGIKSSQFDLKLP